MLLLGFRPPIIDGVGQPQHRAIADHVGDGAAHRQERQGREPPEEILRQIGGMTRPAIGPMRQYAAMGEVGKADAKRHRRPGIDGGQQHQPAAQQPLQDGRSLRPHVPLRAPRMIVERPAIAHQDEGRIADQRREPAAQIGVGRADMRIERLEGQDIADRRHADVDHEHDGDQEAGKRHRMRDRIADPPFDDAREIARHDRDHEGEEEALHRPGPRMIGNLAHVRRAGRAADHPLAKAVGRIARLDQSPVDPEDIGDGRRQQPGRSVQKQVHREAIIAAPVPARDAIEDGDGEPGRPQAGNLDDAGVQHRAQRAGRGRPVDAGRCVAMHLVDDQRPQHHRHATGHHRRQPRIGAVHPIMARHQRPDGQPHKAGDAHPMADGGFGTGIGLGHGRDP